MKITILSYYSGINARGVETFVHHISNELVKHNVQVDVYQGGEPINGSLYVIKKLSSPKILPDIDNSTDVIFPLNGRFQSLLASIWAKKNNKKIIISGQSGLGIDDRINLYTFPNRFIALTKFQSDWARRVNPLVKTEIIPNGVDLSKFNSKQNKFTSNKTNKRILSVGALVTSKRHDLTIKAVSKLSNVTLTIVGDGDEEGYLRDLGKSLLSDRFEIVKSNHSEINKLYSNSDVFVFPTVKYESFGIVLLEALASNLPIVTNDDEIRKEIVGNAGLFVNPENTEEYANKIKEALNREWKDLPRNQSKKYSWDIIGEQYLNLLKKL